MISRRLLMSLATLPLVCASERLSSAALLQPPGLPLPDTVSPVRFNTDAQIYLMRGLANVFSRGMDELGARLRSTGYRPVVANWRAGPNSARQIASTYLSGQRAPIILVGHSLGANTVIEMGHTLSNQNVPIDYMVTLDVTRGLTVPSNVREFVNFFQRNGLGQTVARPSGFRGTMINIDLSDRAYVTHNNMDQKELIQEIIVGKVWQITAIRT